MKNIYILVFTILSLQVAAQRSLQFINATQAHINESHDKNYIRCGTTTPEVNWENDFQQLIQQFESNYNPATGKIVYNVPVIMHVIHSSATSIGSNENLSNSQLYSQISILNNDFAGIGLNVSNVPTVFSSLVANCEVNFILAQRDLAGNQMATPGIDRKSYQSLGLSAPPYVNTYVNSNIKPITIWDPTKYLNIWVLELSSGLLGYATFPPLSSLTGIPSPFVGTTTTDGVVIGYEFFGNNSAAPPYNLGRTATHEVGHWLGLRHIWGDASCGDDFCNDTPTQQGSNGGCPSFPNVTCSNGPNGDMFMNFMDYCNDNCLYMFTLNQKTRMQTALTSSSMRAGVVSASNNVGTPIGGSASLCDTVINFTGSTYYTLRSNVAGLTGFIAGHNSALDKAKAEKFDYPTSFPSGAKIMGLACFTPVAQGAGQTIFSMWSSASGLPGTVLKTANRTNNSLSNSAINYINFASPHIISSGTSFFLGAQLNYAAGDTLVFGSTQADVPSINTVYEQFSNNVWYPFDNSTSWGARYNLTIFALVCDISASLQEKASYFYEKLFISPNPNKGLFDVLLNLSETQNVTLQVTDLSGKLIFDKTESAYQSKVKIDLGNVENGIYFLKISSLNGTIIKKISIVN